MTRTTMRMRMMMMMIDLVLLLLDVDRPPTLSKQTFGNLFLSKNNIVDVINETKNVYVLLVWSLSFFCMWISNRNLQEINEHKFFFWCFTDWTEWGLFPSFNLFLACLLDLYEIRSLKQPNIFQNVRSFFFIQIHS